MQKYGSTAFEHVPPSLVLMSSMSSTSSDLALSACFGLIIPSDAIRSITRSRRSWTSSGFVRGFSRLGDCTTPARVADSEIVRSFADLLKKRFAAASTP